jgi:hypothetical protein
MDLTRASTTSPAAGTWPDRTSRSARSRSTRRVVKERFACRMRDCSLSTRVMSWPWGKVSRNIPVSCVSVVSTAERDCIAIYSACEGWDIPLGVVCRLASATLRAWRELSSETPWTICVANAHCEQGHRQVTGALVIDHFQNRPSKSAPEGTNGEAAPRRCLRLSAIRFSNRSSMLRYWKAQPSGRD